MPLPDIPLLSTWHFLDKRRKIQIIFLFLLMLASTFLEMVSLGAVLPFLAVLVDPQRAFEQPLIAAIASALNIGSPQALMLPLAAGFALVALISGAVRLVLLWGTTRMALVIGADLSVQVYRRALYQPFHVHIARNSSDLIANVTQKVNQTTDAFHQLLLGLTSVVSILGITATLLLVDARIALLTAMGFGLAYGLVVYLSWQRLKSNSVKVKQNTSHVVRTLMEGFGGIRDVLLRGKQDMYVDIYARVDRPLRHAMANNSFIAHSPRVALEAIGIAVIALVAWFLSNTYAGLAPVLPVLGLLALGAQKLLPAFQKLFTAYSVISGFQAVIKEVVEMLEQPIASYLLEPPPEPLAWTSEITLEHVHFRYHSGQAWVLEDISLQIRKGSRVGFVGRTGGGKSTLLDVLMGLLAPEPGKVLVDGRPLVGTHTRAWQSTVAHVSQSIFLNDATIAENIAFGESYDDIDFEHLRKIARIAQVEEFVTALPNGYDSEIGERGVRLSGGQRQRVGIARALYLKASVLVLDEATSALDSATERTVMAGINKLDPELTILMIAHRISTVKNCDKIVMLEQGRLLREGTYQQLLDTEPLFRAIADQKGGDTTSV